MTRRSPGRTPLPVRFRAKHVPDPNSGCWLWTGCVNAKGYGQINISRTEGNALAHRVAWVLHHGKIPDGWCVCHRCDVPCCVNPAHLFLGTLADNMADMARKGRSGSQLKPWTRPRGVDHANARLVPDQVRAIREDLERGAAVRALARLYAVDRGTITSIRDGLTWRHVT